MLYSLPAKLVIPICILCTLLAGCGGSGDGTSTPTTASTSETSEEQATPVEADDVPSNETASSERDTLIALVKSIQSSENDDGVPLAFNECWIDETLEINGLSAAELMVILETGDNDQVLDNHMGEVVQTCVGQLSAEDFAAVLASGILDDDEPNETLLGNQEKSGKFNGTCFKCGKKGHKAHECRSGGNSGNSNNNNNNSNTGKAKFKGKCNNCGKIGHKAADCWEKEENAHKRPKNYKVKGSDANNANACCLAPIQPNPSIVS